MRTPRLLIALCAIYLTGCSQTKVKSTEVKSTCLPITHATKVTVSGEPSIKSSKIPYVITDQARISNLVAFFNARRDCRSTVAALPFVNNGAVYSNETEFLATVSWGSDFLILEGKGCKGTRAATAAELKEFNTLLAFDPKHDKVIEVIQ